MVRRGKALPLTSADCVKCGLCCLSTQDQEVFVDLVDEDIDRLGKAWVKRNAMGIPLFDRVVGAIDGNAVPDAAIKTKWREVKAGPLKGIEVCGCIALKGNPMKSVSCTIYEKRPRACRVAVEPGDKTCLELRRLYQDFVDNQDTQLRTPR